MSTASKDPALTAKDSGVYPPRLQQFLREALAQAHEPLRRLMSWSSTVAAHCCRHALNLFRATGPGRNHSSPVEPIHRQGLNSSAIGLASAITLIPHDCPDLPPQQALVSGQARLESLVLRDSRPIGCSTNIAVVLERDHFKPYSI